MLENLRELYRYRELLISWTMRDIKVRYKQSILGAAWAVIQPLAVMIVFTLIFSLIARVPSDGLPYPLFSYAALVPWMLLSTSLSVAVPSVVNNMGLVTKTYFPREILPISAVTTALVDFAIAAVIFACLMAYYRVPVQLAVVIVPFLLALQVALILGVTMWAAALNVFYRDIRFVVPLGAQLWMYLTPIIYPISLVPERFQAIYMLNPMASIVDTYRRALLLGQFPDWRHFILAASISIAVLIFGYSSFKRAEPRFADMI